MKIELTVNGLKVQAQYSDDEIENVHKPLLRMLAALQTVNPQRRTVVFLCAPPGTGKSTLTTFWEYLAQQDPELPAIQTLPMDGFHHYNSWLDAHQLRPFKGAPETFDVAKLAENLRQSWKGIVRGRSTIDKSMILLKMRCTLPHHSSSSKETGCCWTTRSGASLRNFVISRSLSTRQLLRCGNDWWGASWREGYRWQTLKPFMNVPTAQMFAGCLKRVCLQI